VEWQLHAYVGMLLLLLLLLLLLSLFAVVAACSSLPSPPPLTKIEASVDLPLPLVPHSRTIMHRRRSRRLCQQP